MLRSYTTVLIDGTGYLFRAFHALPPLTNSAGEPTGAIYGLLNMLRKLKKDYSDSNMIVVFDAPGPTFRDKIFADYKATRSRMPDDLGVQIAPAQAILKAQGLPVLIEQGVEADDVIGTLAVQAEQSDQSVLICTSDKDMAQLVSDRVNLFDSMKDKLMDVKAVQKKFGVLPEKIVDYLALMGDKSDNIPGVPGAGPKTAVKWLNEYGSLAGVLENREAIGGKVGDQLRASVEAATLSKELATIKCDLTLSKNLNELLPVPPDLSALKDLYQKLEYKNGLQEIAKLEKAATDYRLMTSVKMLSDWIDNLTEDVIGYEVVGIGSRVHAHWIGIAFSTAPNSGCYLPLGHQNPPNLPLSGTLKELRRLFEKPELTFIGQHIKQSLHFFASHDIRYKATLLDISLASYVLHSVARHDLASLSQKWTGSVPGSLDSLMGKGKAKKTLAELDAAEIAPYMAEYPDLILQIHTPLGEALKKEPELERLFTDMEMPLAFILAEMERYGACIDPTILQKQSEEIGKRVKALQAQIYKAAGRQFNLNSPQQMQRVLYEELKLPVPRKTPKGAPSTAEPVLAELALQHELPQAIIDYRALVKLQTTYLDKLPEDIREDTGRIHTSFHQVVTSTGRLSSSDPNLQNIPIRTEDGRRIRQAFIAPDGKKLISADYSQIELRIMAHLSEDAGLLKAFADNQDIHRATAAEVLGLPVSEVTQAQRRDAKVVNFGLIYGMSSFGLSRQLGISRWAAQDYIGRYFERYPGIKNYMDATLAQARAQGYVETVFGRRLHLPNIEASNARLKQAAERAAINAPMQGTAADIIKRAMVSLSKVSEPKSAKMILQVHDELVFEVDDKDVEVLTEKLTDCMSQAADLKVPLVVNTQSGNNWMEAH